MLNEVQAVSALALIAVLVFFVGSNINRKNWINIRAGCRIRQEMPG